jgi:DNA-binding NarL/FixJ family response regulator
MTAYDDDDIRIRASQAGAAGFVLKPFSDESLFQTVDSALANRHPER